MNPLPTALAAYLLLALDLALQPALGYGSSNVTPQLLIPFVVYLALLGPATPVLWVSLLIGAAVDLTTRLPRQAAPGAEAIRETICLLGPHALGYLAVAFITLTVRGLLSRRNPLTLVAVSVVASALSGLVIVAVLTLRHVFDSSLLWHPSEELVSHMAAAVYTGIAAIVLHFVLRPLSGVLGFQDAPQRRMGR